MKVISWNVNGIRAASRAGFVEWLQNEAADIICLQETKAHPDQLDEGLLAPSGYSTFWHSAVKPGYSGVALYSKTEPLGVKMGIGVPEIDIEGRVLIAEYPSFVMINAYFPNSQREHARLPYKLLFCKKMLELCQRYRSEGKNIILCGDLNIAHKEIDLKNPKANEDNAGFLPEERAWLDEFSSCGYFDAFRHFTKEGGHYTWWSYRPGVREKNIGWRLDYFWMNEEMKGQLVEAIHHPHTKGSDHCPVLIRLKD